MTRKRRPTRPPAQPEPCVVCGGRTAGRATKDGVVHRAGKTPVSVLTGSPLCGSHWIDEGGAR